MRRGFLVALAVALVAAAACNNNNDTTTTGPSPAAPSISETFTGTVPLVDTHNGSDFHNFSVGQSGTVNITLTAIGPQPGVPATLQVGVGIGTPTGNTCPLPPTFGSLTTAAGPNVIGSATLNSGTYCLVVFDVGNNPAPVTYSVTVAHP
jgi:hypothetical protein